MGQLTPSQARVLDPILTEVALGYRQPAGFVADILFPVVQVPARAGQIITFSPEDFALVSTVRAPGQNTRRVQFGRATGNFSLVDFSLEAVVPREIMEEAAAVPNLDEASMAVKRVQNLMNLERENAAATLARNLSNYGALNKVTLSGASQWHQTTSDPFTDIKTGKEAVRKAIGFRPNVLVLGPLALAALSIHQKVLDRKANVNDRTPASLVELARLFDVDRVVEGTAIYNNNGTMTDVWGGDALLVYVDQASAADMGVPAYGYTYQLRGYPFVEEPYVDRSAKSFIYPVTDARQPQLTGMSAGYLISAAAA